MQGTNLVAGETVAHALLRRSLPLLPTFIKLSPSCAVVTTSFPSGVLINRTWMVSRTLSRGSAGDVEEAREEVGREAEGEKEEARGEEEKGCRPCSKKE